MRHKTVDNTKLVARVLEHLLTFGYREVEHTEAMEQDRHHLHRIKVDGIEYVLKRTTPIEAEALRVVSGNPFTAQIEHAFDLQRTFPEMGSMDTIVLTRYIPGTTLQSHVAETSAKPVTPLDDHAWYLLAYSLCRGILPLHQQGMAYVDFKPGNVILQQKDSKPKLIDFDAARHINGVSQSLMYTAGYMSPDFYAANLNEKMDTWGIGALLYFATTGHPPNDMTKDKAYAKELDTFMKELDEGQADFTGVPDRMADEAHKQHLNVSVIRSMQDDYPSRVAAFERIIHGQRNAARDDDIPMRWLGTAMQYKQACRNAFIAKQEYLARKYRSRVEVPVLPSMGMSKLLMLSLQEDPDLRPSVDDLLRKTQFYAEKEGHDLSRPRRPYGPRKGHLPVQ